MDWSVIIFKRTMTNISFNITYLQDNYLRTYMSMNEFMTDTQMVAVLTYLCTLCFRLRASDWTSNVQRRKCRILPFTRNCPVTSAPCVWLGWCKKDNVRAILKSDPQCHTLDAFLLKSPTCVTLLSNFFHGHLHPRACTKPIISK